MYLEVEEVWVDQSLEGGSVLRMSACPAAFGAATEGSPKPVFARICGLESPIAVAEIRFVACIKGKAILEVAALHSADFAPPLQAPFVSLISGSQQELF